MTDENERLDPDEIARILSNPYKREIRRELIVDSDGFTEDIAVKTSKQMTEGGMVTEKDAVVAKILTCGHPVTDVRQIMRCKYDENRPHEVCRSCIARCEGCRKLVCIYHSYKYEDGNGKEQVYCLDCGRRYEDYVESENTITKKAFRLVKEMLRKEEP